MEEENKLKLRGHQLNSFSNHHLQDIIVMALAEQIPFENAWKKYYYSMERTQYNNYLVQIGLTQYQISDSLINEVLPFTQEEVEDAITSKIQKQKAEAQAKLTQVEKSWKTQSKVFFDELQEEKTEQFLVWARKEIEKSTQSNRLLPLLSAILGGLILLYLIYLWLYHGSIIDYLAWLMGPIKTLLTGKTPYNAGAYYMHVSLFFLGFIVLSGLSSIITVPLTLSLWSTFIEGPKISHLAKFKAKQVAKDRYNHTVAILKDYHQRGFSEFFEDGAKRQLIPSAIPSDYWNQISGQYSRNKEVLEVVKSWEKTYPEQEIKEVFKQDKEWKSASKEYNERFNNGSSMLSVLPEAYHDSESLSAIWQLLNEGRADTWKESVNLMKTEQFRDNILSEISQIYQSVDNLSTQLAYDGQKLRNSLEFSIQQHQNNYVELEHSNRQQTKLLKQNNQLLETQNAITSSLLLAELVTR